jgi:flagellar capping protein FliD
MPKGRVTTYSDSNKKKSNQNLDNDINNNDDRKERKQRQLQRRFRAISEASYQSDKDL